MAIDLTNVAVSTGYVQLLHIDGGVGGSVTRVYDGDGTGTPLQISTSEVQIIDGSYNFDIASHDGTNGLKLGGTLVTTSAAELNLLDGIVAGTVSASKFLLVDSNKDLSGIRNLTGTGTAQFANFTATGNTSIGDAVSDTVAVNATITTNLIFEGSTANDYETTLAITDPTADRTWTIPDSTDTFVGKVTTDTLTNKTLTAPDINTPDIDGGTVDAITSLTVANSVDVGNYTITANGFTADGTVSFGSLTDGTITITDFVDEDNMSSNSAVKVPTQQSVKAYVDAVTTSLNAQDLDFSGDSGGALNIDLDSESLTLTGGTGVVTVGSGNTITFNSVDSEIVHDNLSGFVANEHIDHTAVTLTAGVGLSGGGTIAANRTFTVDLNELTTETTIADADFIAMVDATDNGSGKITFENLEDAIFSSVSGDVLITEAGVASIQANAVALATDTTGDYVQNITGGTGLTSSGATSGENIAHSLSVDASQAQVTTVGTLNAGAISSGFGAIDIGSNNLTTTGTVSLGATSFSGAIDFNSQNMTEVDIDSGTIDGATIATSNVTVGSGKTLDVSAGTLTLAANQISGDKVEGGTIAATTISALTTAAITATANIDIGSHDLRAATLTADGLTAGRVVFAGTNGVLSHDSDLSFSGSTLSATNVAISGTLTTTGSVQEVSTTNLNVEDPLILLNKYDSQPGNNLFDAGIVIKRGSSDSAPANVAIIWDESENTFGFIDTDDDGTTAGNVTVTDYENLRVGALTADDASTFTSTISTATGSTIGNLTFANGSITDSSGAISFGNENLSTSGTLGAGVITATGLTIGSAVITEAELEILDGASLTTTELNYVDGVTSAIQTQIDTKSPIANPTFTGTITIGSAAIAEAELEMIDGITAGTAAASKAVVLDGSKNIATLGTIGSGAITATGSSSFATSIKTPLIEYTDGDDAITIADGGGITAAAGITSTAASNSFGATAFSGAVTTNSTIDGIDIATRDAILTSTTTTAGAALPKAGGTMTGNIVMGDDTSIGIADDAERIEFDGAGDISVLGAKLGIGDTAPAVGLDVHWDNEISAGFGRADNATNFISIRTAETADNLAGIAFMVGDATQTGVSSSFQFAGVTAKVISGSDSVLDGELGFYTNSGNNIAQKMVINKDGNVGIGTGSPAASLHINTSANSPMIVESTHGDGGYIELQLSDSGGAGSLTGYIGDSQAIVTSGDAGDLAIRAQGDFVVSTGGATERFKVDSSGNVGIGESVPLTSIHVDGAEHAILVGDDAFGGLHGGNAGLGTFGMNLYRNSSNVHKTLGSHASVGYGGIFIGGTDIKFYSQSGATTAGATVSPTTRMTLTNAGDLTITGRAYTTDGSASYPAYSFSDSNTGMYTAGADRLNFSTGGTERMMIRTGLSVKGAFVNVVDNNPDSYQISFGGDDASNPRWGFRVSDGDNGEDLYLDRNLNVSGRANALKIEKGDGTVSIPGSLSVTGVLTNTTRIQITKDSASAILNVHNSHGSAPVGIDIAFTGAEPNNTTQWFIQGRDASADEFKIFSDGSYSQISDISVKENISEVDSMISKINELRVVNYNRKRDVSKKNHVGIIAQELEEVFPHLISKNDDDTLMVYKIGLVMPLIKAVQELSAKVEALENA
jgi:hypothetical protein